MKKLLLILLLLFAGCQDMTKQSNELVSYDSYAWPDTSLIANCDITNFSFINANTIAFDLLVQVTDTNFKMGSSTFTFSGLQNATKISIDDINPKYTLGSYNYYQMRAQLFGDKGSVQIISLDPLGGSKVSGQYEKICRVLITYNQLPTINWVIANTFVLNTDYTRYAYLQLNGGFRPSKK